MENQLTKPQPTENKGVTIWGQSPIKYLELCNPKTAVDVLQSKTPSFAVMIKRFGDQSVARAILVLLVNDLLDFFNVGKTMNDSQVVQTVNLMLEDYAMLKIDDFKLCFKRAKKGTYGKVYDRIDGELIFEWLENYMYEKEHEIESFRRNEAIRFEKSNSADVLASQGDAIPMPEWFTVPEKKIAQIGLNAVRERTPEQELFQGFIRQFDQRWLHRKVTKDKTGRSIGGRWVYKYGKILNAEGYLAYKADQLYRVKKYLQNRKSR